MERWIEESRFNPEYWGTDTSAKAWEENLYVAGWVIAVVSCIVAFPFALAAQPGSPLEQIGGRLQFGAIVIGIVMSLSAKLSYLNRINRLRGKGEEEE